MLKSYVLLSLGAVILSGPCSAADFLTGQAARAVMGQPRFDAQNPGVAANTQFGAVGGVAYANGTLFVADSNWLGLLPNNNRVLIFDYIKYRIPAVDAEIAPNVGRCPVCGSQADVLLGQTAFGNTGSTPVTQASMAIPTAVASDGTTLAVADTFNNRVLIWKSIPATIGQPADVVLGQPDFVTVQKVSLTASSLRGPQGVWIQNGKLYVADTQNNRILIWNSIPTQNNQPADLVLGQPNFTTAPQINQVNLALTAAANIMLSPTSVTSDGTRLYVSDLGYSRVLIWNTIPTTNQQAADMEIGQKDMTFSIANDSPDLCMSNGVDTNGNATYPDRCGTTLNFPRYALSDGHRLFIADGGNDRVLVFNSLPTQNAAKADVIIGQPDEFSDIYSSSDQLTVSASDITPTPTSLAWDGDNLYVADATDYRILVFSPAHPDVPLNSVVNDASRAVFAAATIVVGGTITANNTATVIISTVHYTYTVKSTDTLEDVAKGLTALINAGTGDPNVFASEVSGFATIQLVARQPGSSGNNVTLGTTVSSTATVTLTANAVSLTGGGEASIIAPGSVVLLHGASNLADTAVSASPDGINFPSTLPFELGGVELYFDGIRAGLFSVSPTEIRAQFPFLTTGSSTVSCWVRITHADGSVTVTAAINIPVEEQNPGIYADPTVGAPEPRTAIAYHGSSYATGTVTVAGLPQTGDTAAITIGTSTYTYTVVANDTASIVEDKLIALINADPSALATASRSGLGTNIRLQAKVPGTAGNGIVLTATDTTLSSNTTGSQVALAATNAVLCCANTAGAPITPDNPALPGETITFHATGLGLVCATPVVGGLCSVYPDAALSAIVDGSAYQGPANNNTTATLFGTAGNINSTVISASLVVGQIGLYQVTFEISSTVTPNPQTQLSIEAAKLVNGFLNGNTSNLVVIPVGSPPQ